MQTTNTELKQAIDQTLKIAKSGNLIADIIANDSKSTKLSSEDQKLSEFTVSSSSILGVRVIDGEGRVGVAYSESLDNDSLATMVAKAQSAAQITEADPYQKIEQAQNTVLEATNQRSYRPEEVPMQKKIDLTLRLERDLLDRDSKIKNTPYNGLQEVESELIYANTVGALCSQRKKSYQCYSSALMEDGQNQSMYYQGRVARTFDELDVSGCLDEIYQHTQNLLKGEPIETGSYDVIFDTDTFESLLSAHSSILSGKSAILKMNPWQEMVGKKVAAESFTLTDSPTYSDGLDDTLFDDEGHKRQEFALVENGILRSFYHNSATARELQTQNNYCAARSAKGHLSVTGTNKVITPGKTKTAQLESGNYLKIIKLQGLHSGTNPISGDFSLGASGYLMKDGQIQSVVKGITLSGNFYRALNSITLGDELCASHGQRFFAPVIRFSDLSVGGK